MVINQMRLLSLGFSAFSLCVPPTFSSRPYRYFSASILTNRINGKYEYWTTNDLLILTLLCFFFIILISSFYLLCIVMKKYEWKRQHELSFYNYRKVKKILRINNRIIYVEKNTLKINIPCHINVFGSRIAPWIPKAWCFFGS